MGCKSPTVLDAADAADDERFYQAFEQWLNKALNRKIPDKVVAFCFNINEDVGGKWSVELVGASSFDKDDDDWPCDEVFTTRRRPFVWLAQSDWRSILSKVQNVVRAYMERGQKAPVLKSRQGIAVGFVDGDLLILQPEEENIMKTVYREIKRLQKHGLTMEVEGKDIIIADACYFVKSTEIWEKYWYDFAVNKSLDKLGCSNALCLDFSDVYKCLLVDDEGKILTSFVSDSYIVGCFLLDEVLAYNPSFADEMEGICAIFRNFTGTISFVIEDPDNYKERSGVPVITIVGKGSQNFHSDF